MTCGRVRMLGLFGEDDSRILSVADTGFRLVRYGRDRSGRWDRSGKGRRTPVEESPGGAEKTTCGFYATGGIGGGIPVRKGWCRKKHDEPNDGLSFGFPCGRKRMLVLRRHPLSCVRNRTAFGAENVCPKHCFPVTRARRLRSPRPRRTCCRLRRSCLRRKPCCGRRPMPRRRSDGILPSVRMPRRGGKARFRPVRVEWPLS